MTTFPTEQPTDARAADLRRTLEHVLAHPEEYRQHLWGYRYARGEPRHDAMSSSACRTVFCLAGHVAVTVAGATPVWSDREGDDVGRGSGVGYLHWVVPPDADPRTREDVQEYARRVLGLTSLQSTHLFRGGNSLRRAAELAFYYTGGRVDVLDRLPEPTQSDRDNEAEDRWYAVNVAYDVADW